jgi:hypothetical protein
MSSSFVFPFPKAGLESYENSIIRAGRFRRPGRRSLSHIWSPDFHVSVAWVLLFLLFRPWTAMIVTLFLHVGLSFSLKEITYGGDLLNCSRIMGARVWCNGAENIMEPRFVTLRLVKVDTVRVCHFFTGWFLEPCHSTPCSSRARQPQVVRSNIKTVKLTNS